MSSTVPTARMPLSVVIVSGNTRELILDALRSLLGAGDLEIEVVVADNASTIVHFGGGSSRLAARRNFLEHRCSMLRFFRKHRGPTATQAARVLLVLFLIVRLLFWWVRAHVGPDRAAAAARVTLYRGGIRFLLQRLQRILGGAGGVASG